MNHQLFIASASLLLFLSGPAVAMDVQVFERGGNVHVVGDDLPDSILIEGRGNGVVRISGRKTGPFGYWPTLINGSTSPITITVERNLIVDLRDGGGDDVELQGVYLYLDSRSNIDLLFGRSSDTLTADSVICSGRFNADLGAGTDFADSKDVVAREVGYFQGSGGSYLHTTNVNAILFEMDLGSGNDGVYLGNISTNLIDVHLGSDNDSLTFASGISSTQFSRIDGGSGHDKRNNGQGLLSRYRGNFPGFESIHKNRLFGF